MAPFDCFSDSACALRLKFDAVIGNLLADGQQFRRLDAHSNNLFYYSEFMGLLQFFPEGVNNDTDGIFIML